MSGLDLSVGGMDQIAKVLTSFIGSSGGSISGASMSGSGSVLTLSDHVTSGFEGEVMTGWAGSSDQLKDTSHAVNQISSGSISIDMKKNSGSTVFVFARPVKRGLTDNLQKAILEILPDLGMRPMDGTTSLSVIMGTVTVGTDGLIAGVDTSLREMRT